MVAALVAGLGELAGTAPLLIVIDDVLWLDGATLELLEAAVASLATSPILVAIAYRDDEPVPDAVQRLVDGCRRAGGSELALGQLAIRDVGPLVIGHLGGRSIEPALVRRLHEGSQGNPLFCLELMRAGLADGSIVLTDGRWAVAGLGHLMPDSVRKLVTDRMASLRAPVLRMLEVAAEFGPEIGFEQLAAVLNVPEGELITALDAAIGSRLLVEQGAGYAFAHPLYRCVIFKSVGNRRHALTCLAIASALGGVNADAPPLELAHAASACDEPDLVAEYALEAVASGVRRALPLGAVFEFAAGERATAVFDLAGARRLLAQALDCYRRLPVAVRSSLDARASAAERAGIKAVRPSAG